VALNTIKQPFQKDFGMVVLWCLMPLSTIFHLYHRFWNGLFMEFNATFNNISPIS
jgi:hypothetical protein